MDGRLQFRFIFACDEEYRAATAAERIKRHVVPSV